MPHSYTTVWAWEKERYNIFMTSMYIFEDFVLIFQVLRAGYTINVHCSNLYFIIYHKTYNDELGFEIIRKQKKI